ncbi:hypothetical protein [Haliangium sp.]|uniref:hypothetical protein n=1 Tax=Haliangium sp. TaxID=2663208 RepID=UPI003D0CA39C
MSHLHDIENQELFRLQRRMARMDARFRIILTGALLAAVAAVLLWAPRAMSEPDQPVTAAFPDMYQFTANTPAVADEVNSNFATVRGLAADNAAAIGDNAADIAGLHSGKFNKSGGTVSGNVSVDGNMSVSGRLNVGFRRKECSTPGGAQHYDCSCNSNEVVISGGAHGATTGGKERDGLRESRAISERTWRVACMNEYGRRANCQGFSIMCARLD